MTSVSSNLAASALDTKSDSRRSQLTMKAFVALVACLSVILRFTGLDRSLWVDEAWVANSIATPSLVEMFYYDAWLQTSPPLFLLAVRSTISLFGMSEFAFRIIPLLFGLLSIIVMGLLARRIFSPWFALLAWTLFSLSPNAILYSATLKQYSSELFAATLVLYALVEYQRRATIRSFCWLLAVCLIAMAISYPTVFILPGVVVAVCLQRVAIEENRTAKLDWHGVPLSRGAFLLLATVVVFFTEYYLLLLPNSSPLLDQFWEAAQGGRGFFDSVSYLIVTSAKSLPFPIELLKMNTTIACAFSAIILSGFVLSLVARNWTWLKLLLLCCSVFAMVFVAHWLSFYPIAERTTLLLLPFLVLLLCGSADVILSFIIDSLKLPWLQTTMAVVILAICALSSWVSSTHDSIQKLVSPEEDVFGAASFLSKTANSSDIVWVHASLSENFKLHEKMYGWEGPEVMHGNTGWPCCPRNASNMIGTSTEEAVFQDLTSRIPTNFSGTVWLIYTTREHHWWFAGLYEPEIMNKYFLNNGCTPIEAPTFPNVGLEAFDCH